jgi:predicted membrane chloride channel (bestrophin family)
MRMRNWRCSCKAVLTTAAVLSSSSSRGTTSSYAFVSPHPAHGSRLRRRSSIGNSISISMSSYNGDNLIYNPNSSSSSNANDEDYVYLSPTNALYTGDPSDQRYSASDWLANVKSLPRSTILRAIQGPVLSVMVWSLLVSLIHGILLLFRRTRWMANSMCLSSKPHSFLVSALGLLLVFRTNSAYQRFAEGRKIWENIHSISRSMSRLACLYEQDLGSQRKHRIFRLLGAFPYLLHHHIQPQCLNPSDYTLVKGTQFAIKLQDGADLCRTEIKTKQRDNNGNVIAYIGQGIRRFQATRRKRKQQPMATMEDDADDDDDYCGLDGDDCQTCLVDRRSLPWCLFPPAALRKCADSDNRPLWVCDRLSKEFTTVRYTDNFTSRERLAFLSQIDKLSKCIGECERIHQTAV